MDLSKIKTLIDFVGRSNIAELTVTEKDVTVRIFRTSPGQEAAAEPAQRQDRRRALPMMPATMRRRGSRKLPMR